MMELFGKNFCTHPELEKQRVKNYICSALSSLPSALSHFCLAKHSDGGIIMIHSVFILDAFSGGEIGDDFWSSKL